MSDWDGSERRVNWHCPQHDDMQDMLKKSVPRWAFVSALGTMMTVSIAFASWQVTSFNDVKAEINIRLDKIEETAKRVSEEAKNVAIKESDNSKRMVLERTQNIKEQYQIDIQRFYKVAEDNRILLMKALSEITEVRVQQSKFDAFQRMVLQKVRIQDPNGHE